MLFHCSTAPLLVAVVDGRCGIVLTLGQCHQVDAEFMGPSPKVVSGQNHGVTTVSHTPWVSSVRRMLGNGPEPVIPSKSSFLGSHS